MAKKPTYKELEQRVKELEEEAGERRLLDERIRILSSAIEQSSEGVAIVDMDGNLEYLNDAFATMHGYSTDELLGKNLSIFHTPQQMSSVEAANRQTKETGNFKGKIWHTRCDGTAFPALMHNSLLRDDTGNPFGIIGTLRDITDLVLAEEEIKASEQRFRELFDNMSSGVAVYEAKDNGNDFIFKDFNRAGERIEKVTKDDLIGKSVVDVFPGVKEFGLLDVFKRVWKTGNSENHPISLYKDKRIMGWKENYVYRLLSGEIVAVYDDITSRKQAEETLRKTESLYRLHFEHISDVIYSIDRDLNLINISPSVKHVLGYTSEELLGRPFRELHVLAPEFLEQAASDIISVLGGERIPSVEYQFIARDGTRKWGEVSGAPLIEDGQVVAVVSVARDITERKQAEDALRESEAQKKAILDASIDRIRIVDNNMRIIWANKTTTRELNIVPEELVGQCCYKVLVGKDAPCPKCPTKRAFTSGSIEHTILHQAESKGIKGETYWDSHAIPIKNKAGDIVTCIQVARNITDKIKADEERARLESQLRQAQKMEAIGTLAGGIAHDFNNILFPIIGYAEMGILDIPEEDHVRKTLIEILNASKRASELVQQILTFGRQRDQELKPLKAQLVVKEALKLIRSSLPTTIEIYQYIKKDCAPIMADPSQIHQVVMNLCTNAFHAMEKDGGTLKVNLGEVALTIDEVTGLDMEPGPYLCLTVSDTGQGMNSTTMERIFDPYFTTKEKGKGTGLGLAVVHGIVKSYGGDIRVYSEPEKGTSFHVYIPVIKPDNLASETVSDGPLQTGHEHILLVDDEIQIVDMQKQMLERLGYQVTARTGSIDALEAFREDPAQFDLVITDMTMPNMTGDELTRELKNIRPDIPVILCTGFSEKISKEIADALGIEGFLMKPIVMKDLAKTIRGALNK